jgi:hypothetical protein
MCDYSLMGFPNRLAVAGEELVVHRFPTKSLGLVSPSNPIPAANCSTPRERGFWPTLKSWFKRETPAPVVAVCIPPGSQLVLHDVPGHLQDQVEVGPVEKVTFTQLTANSYAHRDAVRFANGCELPLQNLVVGQRVRVLTVSIEPIPNAPDEFERHSEPVLR